jgi:hypothetical protein
MQHDWYTGATILVRYDDEAQAVLVLARNGKVPPLSLPSSTPHLPRTNVPERSGPHRALRGPHPQALMGKADELLATPPDIRKVDVLAVK